MENHRVDEWLLALERRHLASLTMSEVARALRALSSCYIERREKLGSGAALESGGKRAAFALFYAPLHAIVTKQIVRALPSTMSAINEIVDLGCGTGAAGAAWALETDARVWGIDRHQWAVVEANWTYRQLGLKGRAIQREIGRARLEGTHDTAIVVAYTVNELPDVVRGSLLERLLRVYERGARLLVVEPIARRLTCDAPRATVRRSTVRGASRATVRGALGGTSGHRSEVQRTPERRGSRRAWWDEWKDAFTRAGGRADEWRFNVELPAMQRQLAHAAGLRPAELTARSLYLS